MPNPNDQTNLDPTSERPIRTAANIAHIARHHVTPEEVAEVCDGAHVAVEPRAGRVMPVGRSGRLLPAVVLGPVHHEPNVSFVISARDAAKTERRRYRAEQGGTDHA